MGLRLVLQSRPLCPAFYAISVRRLGTLPAASFRFRLTADTLAVRLTLPTTKRVVDFHHQAIAHGGRTTPEKHPSGCFSSSLSTPRKLEKHLHSRGYPILAERGEEPMTAGGGSLIGSEINRNERSPQCGVATIEVAGS